MPPNEIRDRVIGRRKVDAVQIERDQRFTFDAKKGDWLVTDDLGNQYVSRSLPLPANVERDEQIRRLRRDILGLGYSAIELYERFGLASERSPSSAPPSPPSYTGPTPGALGLPTPLPPKNGRRPIAPP